MNSYDRYVYLLNKIKFMVKLADFNPGMRDSIFRVAKKLNDEAKYLELELLGTPIA